MRKLTRDRTPSKPTESPVPGRRPAVMYARVSSRDQEKEGFSIPAQQKLLRDYAVDKGFHIVEEFIDVETAKRSGRTQFQRMLAYVRKRHQNAPVVLVEKTDRLYRNLKDWVTVDEMKAEIHLVKENIVLSEESRSSEKFMHGIKVLMAKNYVDNLSEEVKKGMYMKAEEGHWPSAAPFGYINRRESDKSYIVPDPERAVLVRNLFDLYARGQHSIKDLVTYAKDFGLTGRRGGKLQASNVHVILRNPIYAGEFYFSGVRYQGKDPTLVSRDLWQRVQNRLDGFPDTRPGPRNFLYQGLMKCGSCGAAVTAEMKKQKYVYYHCSQLCDDSPYVREERISEQLASVVLKGLQLPPEKLAFATRALKASRVDVVRETGERLAAARARYDRLRALLDKAYEDKLDGRIDEAFFARKRIEWEDGMQSAHEAIERYARVDHKVMDVALEVLELVSSAYDLYIRKDPSQQRKMLNLLLSNCELRSGLVTPTYKKPFDALAELAKAPNDEEAESPGGPVRHPVWLGRLDSNQR
ncbi:MAG: recombinase family protein [Pseudomonadota bacterium]|nr:recombinase family protein [Pseudomonadota bacterium]